MPPVVPDQLLDLLVKKAGHFSAYALLAVLWWLALRGRVTPRLALVVAFAIAAVYAGSDELHQSFSPTRHPSVVDVGIDALGAAIGLWVVASLGPEPAGASRVGLSTSTSGGPRPLIAPGSRPLPVASTLRSSRCHH